MSDSPRHHLHGLEHATAEAAKAVDPVCGMRVDPETSAQRAEHAGRTYHFCSATCRTKFQADPEKYTAAQEATPGPPPAPGAIYTCPMHPQIRQVGPGACPICGMAMEPITVTADAGPSPELADMTRRFSIALALTAPVFVLEMSGHLGGAMMLVSHQTSNWIQFALATPVVLWAGWPFFDRAWTSIRDSNVSTFITCIILYWIGSVVGEPKMQGFALTLGIGVALSMFSAITITKNFMRFLVGTNLENNLPLFGVPKLEQTSNAKEPR